MNQSPKLILVLGRPASGKSTFGRNLAKRLSATILDIDTATEPVIRAAMKALSGDPDDRDSPRFKETFREAIHECLFAVAKENLETSHVVIAAPFTKEQRDPDWLGTVASKLSLDTPPLAVFLRCDSETLRNRIAKRNNPRDLPKLANWSKYEAYYTTEAVPAFPHLIVDTTSSAEIDKAIETIAIEI